MKTFKILAIAALVASATVQAEVRNVSVIFGGWSQHVTDVEPLSGRGWNSSHNMKGLVFNDKFVIMGFKTSYFRSATLVGYNYNVSSFQVNDEIRVDFSVMAGIVKGYKKSEADFAYIGNGFSVYLTPNLLTTYNLTDKVSISVDIGVMPISGGFVATQHLQLNFKF